MRFLLFLMFATKASAITVGAKTYRRLSSAYKVLLFQAALAFVIEAIGLYMGIIKGINNTWLINIYNIAELWLLLNVVMQLLNKSKKSTMFFYIIATVISVGWATSIYVYGFSKLANWSHLAGSIVLLFLFILVLFDLSNRGIKLTSSSEFWLSLGLIIFSGATIPLYGLLNYLLEKNLGVLVKLYYINQIASIVRYAFITISFVIIAKSTQLAINE